MFWVAVTLDFWHSEWGFSTSWFKIQCLHEGALEEARQFLVDELAGP